MRTKKTLALFLSMLTAILCVGGCKKNNESKLDYPDRGYATADKDSWLQIEDGDEQLTIKWYVNSSGFSNNLSLSTKVGKRIYDKTGIKIEFMMPVLDDGAQLSTMIQGNKLPDVVTVGTTAKERFQLANDGYVYSLDELAKRYAPTLSNRIDPEIRSYFEAEDKNVYALPNHFYTTSDMTAYEEQEAQNLLPNGAIVARKDYLDAYVAYKKSVDSSWSDVKATTPSGFVEMCEWVKSHFNLKANNPTVCLSPFTQTGSNAMLWLEEYFCVPKENKDGNLTIDYESEEYAEILSFLNELFRKNLISSGNLSANATNVTSYIANAYPFVFIGSPQDYSAAFNTALKEKNVEYVPIVITNSAGDAPQLRSLAGRGWLCSMITNGCKRPDRVIKLFDYLMSDEGQSLFFGIEGEDFTYDVPAGGTDGGKTYKYGRIKWSEKAWNDILNEETQGYGFMYSNMFVNPMYPRLASPNGEVLFSYENYVDYNMKAGLIDYTFNYKGFEFVRNPLDPEYNSMLSVSASITNLWANRFGSIIGAAKAETAEQIYEATLNEAYAMGAKKLLAYDNALFIKNKAASGMKFAWAPNDPLSGYSDLKVTSIYGTTKYNKEIPDELKKRK